MISDVIGAHSTNRPAVGEPYPLESTAQRMSQKTATSAMNSGA